MGKYRTLLDVVPHETGLVVSLTLAMIICVTSGKLSYRMLEVYPKGSGSLAIPETLG